MSEVWLSVAMMAVGNRWGFGSEFYQTDKDAAFKAMRDTKSGVALPADVFPASIYAEDAKSQPSKLANLPPLFFSGHLFASAAVATAMGEGLVGNCNFHPVAAFAQDRVTPLKSKYFALNIGDTKTCLVPELCVGIRANAYITPPKYQAHEHIKDGEIAVNRSALAGPEIWIDPSLLDAFFVSGEIAAGLIAAGLAKGMQLRKCALA